MRNNRLKLGILILGFVITGGIQAQSVDTFKDDRDGNVYKYVKIGEQIWMAENLRYLPDVVDPATGSSFKPYYYVYGYNKKKVSAAKSTENYSLYGVLYNWTAVMNGARSSSSKPSNVQGVCPSGWHLPSDAEWSELIDYSGGTKEAGNKLKEIGTNHWNSPNEGATNEYNFTALPGGNRNISGKFVINGTYGFWWSATEATSGDAWTRFIDNNSDNVTRNINFKEMGFSVRCVRD
jgi:uncharacterized protein (TIGR02145 family)